MTFISSACLEITGYYPHELIYDKEKSYGSLIHPEDNEYVWNGVMSAVKGHSRFDLEYRILNKNNKWIWVWDRGMALYDKNNYPIELEGFITNINTRKLAEASIERARDFYLQLFEEFPALIWRSGLDRMCNYFNKTWLDFTGRTIEQEYGNGWAEGVHPEDLDFCIKKYVQSFDKHESFQMFYRLKHSSGEYRWINDIGRPYYDMDGEFAGYIGTCFDITELKTAQERIQLSNQTLYDIINAIPSGLLIYKYELPDRLVLERGNPAGETLASIRLNDLLGKEIEEIFPSIRNNGLKEKYLEVVRTKKNILFEDIEYTDNNIAGSFRIFVFSIPGDKLGVSFESITALKQAEHDLKRYNEELIKAKERAEESYMFKTTFLANISHEIRTPMNGIIGFAQFLLEDDLPNGERIEYATIINQSGKRLLELINNVIDLSKIEAGQIEVNITDTNLDDLLRDVYKFFHPIVEKKHLSFELDTESVPAGNIIKTDGRMIYQIFSNLIGNAIKFTEQGGITIGYRDKGNCVEFFVKDTGIGIAEQFTPRMFHRFQQENATADTNSIGAGLGLSICKGYLELLGGEIRSVSTINEGSTFYFTIEKSTFLASESSINADSEMPTDFEEEIMEKKYKVLIAEDDAVNYMLLNKMLIRLAECEILYATNGKEAVELVEANTDISFVLMDLKMPIMDGYMATRKIKEIRANLPIIAVTAFAMAGDREKALAAGCDGYLAKPIELKDLKRAIGIYL
jgi:PAS domain S-box-containing protein